MLELQLDGHSNPDYDEMREMNSSILIRKDNLFAFLASLILKRET